MNDELLKLTPNQQRRLRNLEIMERNREIRAWRDRGRLFIGSAPDAECAAERAKLFRELDAVIEYMGATKIDVLIRYLREKYEDPTVDKGSRQMRLISDVEELREWEAQRWEELKDKGGKRAGAWVATSKKRKRR
jgi:hypothetical protein